MRFDIQPYVGALPITFGMRRDEVHRLVGPPEASDPVWSKTGFAEHYQGFNVGYDNSWIVNHLGFIPGSVDLAIQGKTIWTQESQPDPNPIFLALDPEPLESVGIWNFLRIGVTTTGYHDDDPNQRAISVFTRGSDAELLERAKPADTSIYLSQNG